MYLGGYQKQNQFLKTLFKFMVSRKKAVVEEKKKKGSEKNLTCHWCPSVVLVTAKPTASFLLPPGQIPFPPRSHPVRHLLFLLITSSCICTCYDTVPLIIFPRTHTFSPDLNSACLEDKSFIFCYFMFFSQGLLRIHIPPTRCSISRSWFVTTALIQFVKIFFPCSFEIQLSNNPFQKSSSSAFSLTLSLSHSNN